MTTSLTTMGTIKTELEAFITQKKSALTHQLSVEGFREYYYTDNTRMNASPLYTCGMLFFLACMAPLIAHGHITGQELYPLTNLPGSLAVIGVSVPVVVGGVMHIVLTVHSWLQTQ